MEVEGPDRRRCLVADFLAFDDIERGGCIIEEGQRGSMATTSPHCMVSATETWLPFQQQVVLNLFICVVLLLGWLLDIRGVVDVEPESS